jgi:hypothetical protein
MEQVEVEIEARLRHPACEKLQQAGEIGDAQRRRAWRGIFKC